MSSTYNPSATFVDIQSLEDSDLGQFDHLPSTPYDHHNHLSPYNSHNLSSSASPSYTPGDSGYSNYQPSEGDIEDPFFGVNFDDGVQRVDSLPLALAGTATYQALLNRRPTDPAVRKAFANPTYPLSPPLQSSNPNTPPTKRTSIQVKGQTTISQHELTTELHNSRFQSVNLFTSSHLATAHATPDQSGNSHINLYQTAAQLTPEQSGSSHTSAEEISPSIMTNPKNSPPIMVSEWGNNEPSHIFDTEHVNTGDNYLDEKLPVQDSIVRNEDGGWSSNQRTGHAGIDPDSRHGALEAEIPNLKEQEEKRRLDHKNSAVEEWRSQAGGSDAGDEHPSQSYFPMSNEYDFQQPRARSHMGAGEDTPNIHPLDGDDGMSLHENRLIEGQTYFNFNNSGFDEADKNIAQQSRHWTDGPSYPLATNTNFQAPTANEAIMRFYRNSDAFSIASRSATWGTRRRSEPSLADYEGVADGSFLKKLSLSRPSGRSRKDSFFDQSLDRLANMVPNIARKRSDAKMKRARSNANIPEEAQAPPNPRQNSQGSLAPPSRTLSYGKKQQTPSITTGFAAMVSPLAAVGATPTHARSGSISATVTSPRSPAHLGFANRIMNRARSKSDLTQNNDKGQPSIASLWRVNGGPPVATLATPQDQPNIIPNVEVKKPDMRQMDMEEDEEEDDDEQGEEGDMKVDDEVDPIIPNYDGFKAHVRRLNPEMDPKYNWLVSRIGHQQEIRYKTLLDLRVKHSQAIAAGSCSAGPRCLSLGGSVALTDTKGVPRDSGRKTPGLQLVTDFSDDDSNPGEGALTDESFPPGVPKPPTKNLPAEFECQLCFKAKRFQKPSDWTKHVHEDVQPFTCTYEKCKESKSFKRKADWVRHENERHRHLEWWICDVEDCRHPCYRKDNFLQHLVREHKLPEPKQKTKAAIKKARHTEPAWIRLENCHNTTQNRPEDEPCKFCGKTFLTWKKLTVHLSKHMELISLPILRLVEVKNVDANTIISPIEQILTPISPLTRAKNESDSPFNIDSISPHMPMMNQFPSNGFNGQQYFQNHGPTGPYGMSTQMPQEVQFGQPMYPNSYDVQPMDQQRTFGSLDSGNMNHMGQSRGFEHMGNTYPQPKMEQQSRGFGSLDSGSVYPSHGLPITDFHAQQTSGFSVPQMYPAAPAVSTFQGISDTGFGFDPMAINGGQQFQNTPMSRSQGSASSYGNSPPHATYYGR